ncbi:hypothetical protein ACJW30_11G177800 [Castanea mollissima]
MISTRIIDWLSENVLKMKAGKLYNISQRLLESKDGARKNICLSNLPFIVAIAEIPKHIDTTLTSVKLEELCSDLLDRCHKRSCRAKMAM